MSRLLWRFTTPRRLRRGSLVILLSWTLVAFAHQQLAVGSEHQQHLPRQVDVPASSTR